MDFGGDANMQSISEAWLCTIAACSETVPAPSENGGGGVDTVLNVASSLLIRPDWGVLDSALWPPVPFPPNF